jgi:hypothetical protein
VRGFDVANEILSLCMCNVATVENILKLFVSTQLRLTTELSIAIDDQFRKLLSKRKQLIQSVVQFFPSLYSACLLLVRVISVIVKVVA